MVACMRTEHVLRRLTLLFSPPGKTPQRDTFQKTEGPGTWFHTQDTGAATTSALPWILGAPKTSKKDTQSLVLAEKPLLT